MQRSAGYTSWGDVLIPGTGSLLRSVSSCSGPGWGEVSKGTAQRQRVEQEQEQEQEQGRAVSYLGDAL